MRGREGQGFEGGVSRDVERAKSLLVRRLIKVVAVWWRSDRLVEIDARMQLCQDPLQSATSLLECLEIAFGRTSSFRRFDVRAIEVVLRAMGTFYDVSAYTGTYMSYHGAEMQVHRGGCHSLLVLWLFIGPSHLIFFLLQTSHARYIAPSHQYPISTPHMKPCSRLQDPPALSAASPRPLHPPKTSDLARAPHCRGSERHSHSYRLYRCGTLRHRYSGGRTRRCPEV
jgi:hypothetical protein